MNYQNFHYYLRCLVKIAEDRSLSYEEIPKEFRDRFTLPGLSQCINISINNIPEIDMDKVENFINCNKNSYSNFDELAKAIRDTFETVYEQLYASYYFVTQHVEYDEERSKMKEKPPLSIQKIFNTQKGVCSDYAKLFREIAKRVGISSQIIKISPFINASKAEGWDPYNPPSNPDHDHEANYIEINNQSFLSEPTWGSGDSHNCKHKSYFLIPYYRGILDHFPKDLLNESLKCDFTWEHFTSYNIPNTPMELCFESNPFQKITVENGFYDLQFSFIQPVNSINGEISLLKGNVWCEQDIKYLSFNCLGKNLPKHNFSFSNQLRCRYNLTISFLEKGEYKVMVYVNDFRIFTVYFDVKCATDKLMGICGCKKEEYGFQPIVPAKGLTEINNGFARIRFAIKLSRSKIMLSLYRIKKGTIEHEKDKEEQLKDWYSYYTTKFPFKYENEDLNDYLVEDWVLVNFPSDGRWEVEIYFANEKKFIYGVSYYFDVTGTKKDNNIFPIYDLPNNRTFIPFKTIIPDKVWLEPSAQTVIKYEYDNINIHVFSENELSSIYFVKFGTDKAIRPVLLSEEDTGDGNIKDREYSFPSLEKGFYTLDLFYEKQYINSQNYFITDKKLRKESHEEKKLMKELKKIFEGKTDLLKDVPLAIQKEVEEMVEKSIKEAKPNNDNDDEKRINFNNVINESSEYESEEEKENLKNKIKNLETITSNLKSELNKANSKLKEQENHSHLLEQEKNEISIKFNELMKQKENLNSVSVENDKEKSELMVKLRELEQRKDELEKKIENLEQQNDDLNNKFKKQKDEKEKFTHLLENQTIKQDKNDLNDKISLLEKQKEDQEKLTRLLEQEKMI